MACGQVVFNSRRPDNLTLSSREVPTGVSWHRYLMKDTYCRCWWIVLSWGRVYHVSLMSTVISLARHTSPEMPHADRVVALVEAFEKWTLCAKPEWG